MYTPTAADRITGSAALRRRQAIGRGLARLLGRVGTVGLENLPAGAGQLPVVRHRGDRAPMAHRRQAPRPGAQVVFGTPISVTRHPDETRAAA